MSQFKAHKVVSSLPNTLEANTIYIVRIGEGFDLYCTDSTGAIAHTLNKQFLNPVSKLLNLEIFGDYVQGRYYDNQNFVISPTNLETLSSHNISANRIYLFPFYVGKNISIDRLGVTVNNVNTTANMKIGLYSSSSDNILSLKIPNTVIDITTTGFKEISLSPTVSLSNQELHYGAICVDSNPLDCLRAFLPLISSTGKPTAEPNSSFRRITRVYVNHIFADSFPNTINESSFLTPNASFEITHPLISFRVA